MMKKKTMKSINKNCNETTGDWDVLTEDHIDTVCWNVSTESINVSISMERALNT